MILIRLGGYDLDGQIGAVQLAQQTCNAVLEGSHLCFGHTVYNERFFRAKGHTDTAALAPIGIDDNLCR